MKRRTWLKSTLSQLVYGLAGIAGFGTVARMLKQRQQRYLPVSEPSVLRPPGALTAEADFLQACIRCQRCYDSCPSGAIRLGRPGDPVQLGTPFIVAADQACTLCLECTHVCPSGALLPIEELKTVAMGTAVVDERTCVSHNRTGACGACHTVCPLRGKAIVQGLYNAPEVDEDVCVGCGLCEQACILKGVKAIRVFSDRAPA